jgi:hypothetical protein
LNLDSTPIGTVSWFAASAAPTSYLECSGGVVAISDYTDLWYVIGTKFNTGGEGAGNFRIPDLRGEFIRGWDHGRGIDPTTGRVFGSNQADEANISDHTHGLPSGGGVVNPGGTGSIRDTTTDMIGDPDPTSSTTGGGTETRPRNVALLPCIKALKTVTGNVSTLNFIEKPASPTNGQVLTYNGSTSTWVASAATVSSGNITRATAVTLTNQTSVDFTGIPSWAKRITICLSGFSTNGISLPKIQLGSGSIQATGYKGAVWAGAVTATHHSTGFYLINSSTADSYVGHTIVTLIQMVDNLWMVSMTGGYESVYICVGGGSVTLTGALDRLRLTTENGTDQFDAGIVNIMWE